jgi:succinoglycan biosynthesis protein ExoU
MSHDAPTICVVIAAYNSEASVGRAVGSALAQQEASEVIVVDDASTDRTGAAAAAADDGSGRLSVVSLRQNVGPAAARNLALERSPAAWFCVLDADDYLLPGRLSRLLAAGLTDWDLLADDMVIVPKSQAHLELSLRDAGNSDGPAAIDLPAFVLANVSRPRRPRGEMGFLKPLISRAFLRRHALGYDPRLRLGEDYALYVRALMAGARFGLASACGYVAVVREDSISSKHSTADLARLAEFDKECLAFAGLSQRGRDALGRHLAATQRKVDHMSLLDCRRRSGVLAALAGLRRTPASIGYIAAETARAYAQRGLALAGYRRPGEIRLLLGLPGAHVVGGPT